MKINNDPNGINPLGSALFANRKPLVYLGASKYGNGNASNPLEEKTQDARKKAMKLVSDAFHGELEADKMMESQRDRFKELQNELADLTEQINAMEESGLPEEATAEEREEYGKALAEFKKQADAAKTEMRAIDQTLRSTKIERLKTDPVGDAFDQAEKIMEAAGDAAVSEAVSAGMEHIQDELEDKKEEAEKLEEEKERLEEQIEKTREKKKEQEEITEEIPEATNQTQTPGLSVTEAQDQVKNMLSKLGLIEEEIKGAAIDEFT